LGFLGPFRVFYNTKLSPQISRFCVLMVMWCKSPVNNAILVTLNLNPKTKTLKPNPKTKTLKPNPKTKTLKLNPKTKT